MNAMTVDANSKKFYEYIFFILTLFSKLMPLKSVLMLSATHLILKKITFEMQFEIRNKGW
jgi:hypothetical protein